VVNISQGLDKLTQEIKFIRQLQLDQLVRKINIIAVSVSLIHGTRKASTINWMHKCKLKSAVAFCPKCSIHVRLQMPPMMSRGNNRVMLAHATAILVDVDAWIHAESRDFSLAHR
jgi:hypothetical protein